jgi:hypothetical protein
MWYLRPTMGCPARRTHQTSQPRYRTPVWSILISALAVVICLYPPRILSSPPSAPSRSVVYVIPVYLNWRNKRRGRGDARRRKPPWTSAVGVPYQRRGHRLDAVHRRHFQHPPNELVLDDLLLAALLAIYWSFTPRAVSRARRPTSASCNV